MLKKICISLFSLCAVALSFSVIHANEFDAEIAFANQVIEDINSLKAATDAAAIPRKEADDLDDQLNKADRAMDKGIEELEKNNQEKSTKKFRDARKEIADYSRYLSEQIDKGSKKKSNKSKKTKKTKKTKKSKKTRKSKKGDIDESVAAPLLDLAASIENKLDQLISGEFGNGAPVANAGVDQSGTIGDVVRLDGSASSDQYGDSLSYQWSFNSVPGDSSAELTDADQVGPSFVIDVDGDYVINLIVNDGLENSMVDQVTVSTINSRPVADAGHDQRAVAGDDVLLNGSASSDVDGDQLSYFWEIDSAPDASSSALDDATAVTPSITLDSTGKYVIRLTVDDGILISEPDNVIISNENLVPVADAGPDQLALISEIIQLDAIASFDPEAAGLGFQWSLVSAPANSTAAISDATLPNPTVQIDVAGEYVIQLIVNDGALYSAADQTIVSTINIRPLANAGPDQSAVQNDFVQLDGSASSDAEPITFDWALVHHPAGSSASLDDSVAVDPGFDADLVGTYIAQLIVNDGEFDSAPDTVVITVDEPPNQPPEIISEPVTSAAVGELYSYDVDATDAEGDALTYELLLPPSSMTIDPLSGLINWTPDNVGTVGVTVQVSDTESSQVATQSFTVVVGPANQNPIITSAPVTDATTGTAYSYAVVAGDPDGDPITYQLDAGPAGMDIGELGAIRWLPTAAGSFSVSVSVVDIRGGETTQSFSIEVVQANLPPIITTTPVTTAVAESSYSYDVNATDPDGDSLTFALPTAPGGMSIDPDGVISWLPTVAGSYPVVVQASDGIGGIATQSFSILVDPRPNLPPTITSAPAETASIDSDYSYQLVVDDPNNDPLTYSFSQKPLGMNVSITGLVTWKPINDGDYSATVVADDGRGGVVSQSFNVLVSGGAAQTPTLDALDNQTALLGRTLTLQLSASDPNNDDIEFFVAPLPLAANMTLDSASGLFTFTPAGNQVGSYPLKFMATDGRFYAEQIITITVPPPAGVTQLRGQVLTLGDAPLPGVRLEMGGVETLSDANGDFFLDNIPVSGKVRLLVDGNVIDPALGSFATVPEMIPIIAGTENLLQPAIFLLPLDVASADPVDPGQTSIITSSRFTEGLEITEPVTLTIPPGRAIDDATGLPFVGDIHISRVTDPTKGPRPLPEAFDLSVYIAIQPFGVTYPDPVPISFPNVEKFAPDTRMDFFALDHETGVMEKIGEGLVSADGKTVDSIGGVVKSNSWHGIVPQGPVNNDASPPGQSEPVSVSPPSTTPTETPSGCNKCPCDGCSIDKTTGNLKEWHVLPVYTSLEQPRALRLEYNSNIANPRPILPINSGFGNRAAPPDLMSMRINVDGIDMGREIFSEVRVEPSEIRTQFKLTRPVVQINARMFETGIYNYDLATNCYFPISRRQENVLGQIIVNNQSNSPFGAGWTIAGLQRLYVHDSGRVMITEGTAASLIFEPLDPNLDPNGFESPPGDFSRLTRLGDGTLERRMKDGTRHRFDLSGLLAQSIDRNNNTTIYQYNGAQRLRAIIDPVGKSYNLDYAAGKLASITDPFSRVTRFEHDSEGNLTGIIEPNGDRREFEYQVGKNLMTAQIDQRDNRTEYFYSHADRIRETLLPDGSRPRFDIAQIKGLADPQAAGELNDGTRERPTEAPLLLEDVNQTYFDNNGNPLFSELDARHQPTMIKDAIGREYNYQRDDDSNPIKTTRPNSSVVDRDYDNQGNSTSKKELFNDAESQYGYDEFSLVTSYTNPNNHTATYNRDPATGNVNSVVNHLGHTTTFEYESRGLAERMVTENQLEVTFTYTAAGLLQTMTETPPFGSPGNLRLTQYSYDPAGQLTQVITPDGITVDIEYDDKGRRTRMTDNLNQKTEYTYDAHDNLVHTDTRNSDGSLALTMQSIFDSRNRYFESSAPHLGNEDSVSTQELDNNSNVTALTDPNENSASNVYDEEDRLIENTHRLDGISKYEYDTNDRVTKVIAPTGVVTLYSYDLLGRKLTETSADRGSLQYDYDLNNNLVSIIDGRGIATTLIYDELERVKSKTFPNTIAGKTEDVDYIYDDCLFGIGRLCERHDESGTWRYEYDAFGNVVKETRIELGVTYTTEYEYDDGDNISRISYPTGRLVNFDRDGIRRIEAISTDINGVSTNVVNNIQYRADDQMTQCTFGNGLVDNRSYDLQGRLLNQTLGSVDTRTYTFDKNSNMLSRTTTPQTSVYNYDALDRITGDKIGSAETIGYQYDLNYNRQSKSQAANLVDNYDYEAGTNRITRQAIFTEGNLPATVNDRRYVYSDTNRIFQVIDNGLLSAEYVYNDQSQRTRKTVYDNTASPVTSTVTIYHYDMAGNLIAETDSVGVKQKEYVWMNNAPVAQINTDLNVESIYYLHTDHLMTARVATNVSQQISWRWEGEAFGETADQLMGAEVNLRFPGQYYDRETGEHYNWNRYYRAGIGRYITSDPIGLDGGSNTFVYVWLNPLRKIDPRGLKVDMNCVKDANAEYFRCTYAHNLAYSTLSLLCIRLGKADGVCQAVADLVIYNAIEGCREELQDDLRECNKDCD